MVLLHVWLECRKNDQPFHTFETFVQGEADEVSHSHPCDKDFMHNGLELPHQIE